MKKSYSKEEYTAMQSRKMDEILETLETGVRQVFTSEEYVHYLEVFSRFHHYSISNCILIMMAYPHATFCASYTDWKKFNRSVKKGEKGIKILVPTPKKIVVEKEIMNPDGTSHIEKEEHSKMYFKIGHTFDLSQTVGSDLPSLTKELTWNDELLAIAVDSIIQNSPVPISYDEKLNGATVNGYYAPTSTSINIKPTLSDLHKLKTICHELSHYFQESVYQASTEALDRKSKEVIAESCAFCTLKRLQQDFCIPEIDSSMYSFGYIAGWGSKDLKELKSTLQLIRNITDDIYNQISSVFPVST